MAIVIDGLIYFKVDNDYSVEYPNIKKFNVLTGKNGCGKTIILYDIYKTLHTIFENLRTETANEFIITKSDGILFINDEKSEKFNLESENCKIKFKKLCKPFMVTFNADYIKTEIIDDYSINAKLCKSSNKKIGLDFFKSGSNSILRYLAIGFKNLLDEPDSHLNQSAIENFMNIIKED